MKRRVLLTLTLSATAAFGTHALAATESYVVDGIHSSVVFSVKHMNVSNFYGRFNDIEGDFTVDDQDAANTRFEVTIKAGSIDTNNNKRDKHLKGPDFFNVKQFKVITFKSKKVEQQDSTHYLVTGDLELLGQTRPVSVTLERIGSGQGRGGEPLTGFETHFTIKRSEFGMHQMMEGLSDEVKITVSLEGVSKDSAGKDAAAAKDDKDDDDDNDNSD